jgi:hypothetical protein
VLLLNNFLVWLLLAIFHDLRLLLYNTLHLFHLASILLPHFLHFELDVVNMLIILGKHLLTFWRVITNFILKFKILTVRIYSLLLIWLSYRRFCFSSKVRALWLRILLKLKCDFVFRRRILLWILNIRLSGIFSL